MSALDSTHNWLQDATNVIHSLGLETAVLRAKILIHILYKWHASRNRAVVDHAHSENEALCLQPHLNMDPLDQTANKQQIMKNNRNTCSITLPASPLQQK